MKEMLKKVELKIPITSMSIKLSREKVKNITETKEASLKKKKV